MAQTAVIALQQLGDGPEEEKLVNVIGTQFDKLSFDTKISVLTALKDHVSNFDRNPKATL